VGSGGLARGGDARILIAPAGRVNLNQPICHYSLLLQDTLCLAFDFFFLPPESSVLLSRTLGLEAFWSVVLSLVPLQRATPVTHHSVSYTVSNHTRTLP
jgi:hypothetical protein